jgi:hypothetical protein
MLSDFQLGRDFHRQIDHLDIKKRHPQFETEQHAHPVRPLEVDVVQVLDAPAASLHVK